MMNIYIHNHTHFNSTFTYTHAYTGDLCDVAMNLNFDMIGSPNSFYGIYAGSQGPEDIRQVCVCVCV